LGAPGADSHKEVIPVLESPNERLIIHKDSRGGQTILLLVSGQFVKGYGPSVPHAFVPAEKFDNGVLVRVNQIPLNIPRGRSAPVLGNPKVLLTGWRGTPKKDIPDRLHDTLWLLSPDDAIRVSPSARNGRITILYYNGEDLLKGSVEEFCAVVIPAWVELATPEEYAREIERAEDRKVPWMAEVLNRAMAARTAGTKK
jgi:hypothetical protein